MFVFLEILELKVFDETRILSLYIQCKTSFGCLPLIETLDLEVFIKKILHLRTNWYHLECHKKYGFQLQTWQSSENNFKKVKVNTVCRDWEKQQEKNVAKKMEDICKVYNLKKTFEKYKQWLELGLVKGLYV